MASELYFSRLFAGTVQHDALLGDARYFDVDGDGIVDILDLFGNIAGVCTLFRCPCCTPDSRLKPSRAAEIVAVACQE